MEKEPKEIRILSRDEKKQWDMQRQFPDFEYLLGDVRDATRLAVAMEGVDYVFHAAALKQVGSCEKDPFEAVQTNIMGSYQACLAARRAGVKTFVALSTDKAVKPVNAMGTSKAMMEKMVCSQNQKNCQTVFCCVRYGNVMGSRGSVIPLFQRQIAQGGPITVTDERVTRFFMTIPEACQLVLEAGTLGEGGEIFIFDMGESVKIIDLAKKMVKLSGLELGKDIEIRVTGLRPGEKLYEELLSKEENTLPTHHPQILIAKVKEESDESVQSIKKLIQLFDSQDNLQIVAKMKEIVPEFISNNSTFEQLDK